MKTDKCCVCGYTEKNGNTLLDCGRHYMCDECLISGEAIDHECDDNSEQDTEIKILTKEN